MDCLRSAKFTINFNESFVFGSQTFSLRINTRGVNVQVDLNGQFDIQGFKNVDVYGMKFIPEMKFTDFDYFSSGSTTAFSFTNNYDIIISLDGQKELLGGQSVLTNPVLQSTKAYVLNNFTPDVMLASPIKSCKSIDFQTFKATFLGLEYANTGAMAGHSMVLDIKGDFYLYYKFEGE
jgi:hypothetical protein